MYIEDIGVVLWMDGLHMMQVSGQKQFPHSRKHIFALLLIISKNFDMILLILMSVVNTNLGRV